VNDLHSRLSALADDLAPDVDPYAQVAGARALHRRQRRTRLGVAGAALAVALVAVGVPTAVSTLSAPRGSDGAGPAPTTFVAPPSGGSREDERRVDRWTDLLDQREEAQAPLRDLADRLKTRLATGGLLGGAGPSEPLPCPDAAVLLGDTVGLPLLPGPGPTTLDGCSWATADETPEAGRVQLTLRNDPELTTDQLVRDVNAGTNSEGCYPTALPGSTGFSALSLCGTDGRELWTVTVMDGSGTGAWFLTAAVGSALPDDAGVEAILSLRAVVSGEL
jgi:hypothetical protein